MEFFEYIWEISKVEYKINIDMIDKGEFFLENYLSKQKVQLSFNNQIIKIETFNDKYEEYKRIKDKLSACSEFTVLTITESKDKDEVLNLALDIKSLLSIALGQRIIFNKQSYWISDTQTIVNKKMSENYNLGVQIIPDFEIENFLNTTLYKWSELTQVEKTDYFIVTDYLNQTRKDFIEDRILKTMQAWECSANYWTNSVELTADLKELESRIIKTYKDWKKEINYNDINGEIGTNLKISLNQEKLISRLDKFISESNFNEQTINLNLRELKKMRDLVVHQGKIGITGGQAIDILEPAIKVLQIIILKRLGYDGLLIDSINGWRVFKQIDDYFK